MDPITHTLTGAAIATAGFRRRTALAVPAGILAANIPDVDIVTVFFGGEYASLAHRRGWTHGPPAVLLGAVFVLLLMLAWDRYVRQRREHREHPDDGPPRAAPARVRPGPMLLLVLIAAVTHPLLDWMNTYGIRWLMPFDRTWYYGDALFIVDPWLWLLLALPLFLVFSTTWRAIGVWVLLALATSVLVLGTGLVPGGAMVVWAAGILGAAAIRAWRGHAHMAATRYAAVAIVLATAYVGAMVANSRAAARIVEEQVLAMNVRPDRIMIAPVPANPLRAGVVVQRGFEYLPGEFDWRAEPRAQFRYIPVLTEPMDPLVELARHEPEVRDYLTWSRFPVMDAQPWGDGYIVRVRDARYLGGPGTRLLGGVAVRYDAQGRRIGLE